jgi:hypothetical protein
VRRVLQPPRLCEEPTFEVHFVDDALMPRGCVFDGSHEGNLCFTLKAREP